MTRRITRAKQAIADSAVPFAIPAAGERSHRLATVRHVLYLIFTGGYAATTGAGLLRADLCTEAIPADPAAAPATARRHRDGRAGGADAAHRRPPPSPYRTGRGADPDGRAGPPPLGRRRHRRGCRSHHHHAAAAATRPVPAAGRLALYDLLRQASDNPIIALNHAVAAAMVHGPRTGLALLGDLTNDARLANGHRFHAVRAQLLEMAGDPTAARAAYLEATRYTTSLPAARVHHHRHGARRLDHPDHGYVGPHVMFCRYSSRLASGRGSSPSAQSFRSGRRQYMSGSGPPLRRPC